MMRVPIGFIISLICVGCGSPSAPDAPLSDLRRAPAVVTIDGTMIQPQVVVWRDFQPISPADGQPLRVSVRVTPTVPSVAVDRIWVLLGDSVWDATPQRIEGSAEWLATDGPKWGPDVTVDVVSRLRASGATYLVRAADQTILGTH